MIPSEHCKPAPPLLHPSDVHPAADAVWDEARTVAGFVGSPPNQTLLEYARHRRSTTAENRALDIGCGAARNAVPLTEAGWEVVGTDLSWPMLRAAAARPVAGRLSLTMAPMDHLPFRDRTMDLIVAHGVWNLARSGAEFHGAIAEAARVVRPGGSLFVFTFSRATLAESARPLDGEAIVFTQFSGRPQCFVTADQLLDALHASGFTPDHELPMTHLKVPSNGLPMAGGPPVIWQGGFRLE